MSFASFEYAAFLAVVVALHWSLPPRRRPALLLVASYAFYASWSRPAVLVLLVTTAVTWASGLALGRVEGARRTVITAAAVTVSAGSVLSFKVVEAFDLSGRLGTGVLAADFIVPVGLSFFSFQAISYVVDIHRGDLEPSRSPIDVATYLAFFPHLLAGPIVRAGSLIPALRTTPRLPDPRQWSEGAELVLTGVFKKVAVADPLLVLCLAPLRDPASAGTVNVAVALGGALLAGYFDVTGYVDIARGSARFLGIDLPRNALFPLTRSTGYADFWRRWQLTIMTWFRDYVHRPLRGDGRSERRDLAALFATFLVLGIWHGLTPGWLAWGAASGLIIVVERQLRTRRAARRRAQIREARRLRRRSALPAPPSRARSLAVALGLVLLTFPLVTAPGPSASLDLYRTLLLPTAGPFDADLAAEAALAIVALVLLDGRERRREARMGHPDPVGFARAAAFGAMVLAVVVWSGPAPQSFVYFHF